MEDDESRLAKFDAEFTTEPPNNILSRFQGYFRWKNTMDAEPQYYAFNDDNVILRGCRLRNTAWVNGLVVFAGNSRDVIGHHRRHLRRILLAHFSALEKLCALKSALSSLWGDTDCNLSFDAQVPTPKCARIPERVTSNAPDWTEPPTTTCLLSALSWQQQYPW